MAGLVQYFNNAGAGKDGRHMPITNWFFWAWNDNTPGAARVLFVYADAGLSVARCASAWRGSVAGSMILLELVLLCCAVLASDHHLRCWELNV
jgi:hypothetical protein